MNEEIISIERGKFDKEEIQSTRDKFKNETRRGRQIEKN